MSGCQNVTVEDEGAVLAIQHSDCTLLMARHWSTPALRDYMGPPWEHGSCQSVGPSVSLARLGTWTIWSRPASPGLQRQSSHGLRDVPATVTLGGTRSAAGQGRHRMGQPGMGKQTGSDLFAAVSGCKSSNLPKRHLTHISNACTLPTQRNPCRTSPRLQDANPSLGDTPSLI